MSNLDDNWPEDQKPVHRPAEETDIDGKTDEILFFGHDSKINPKHDEDARHFIYIVAWFVPVLVMWFIFFANLTWYFGALTILAVIGWAVIAYRIDSGIETSCTVVVVTVCNTWAVYFFHQVVVLHVLAWISLSFIPLLILRVVRGSLEQAEAAAAADLEKPCPPSERLAKRLTDDELLWQEMRRHPMSLILWWAGFVVATAVCIMLARYVWPAMYSLVLWGVVVAVMTVRLVVWWEYRFGFSNLRLLSLQGLFTVKLSQMPLADVTDSSFTVPWHSWLLARLRLVRVEYGNFRFESPGQKQDIKRMTFVPNAQAVNRKYTGQMLKKGSE